MNQQLDIRQTARQAVRAPKPAIPEVVAADMEISAELPPTLLIYADDDLGSMISDDEARAFVAAVPRATVDCIPGAGHNIHREKPAEFLALAVPFLRAVAGL